MWREPRSKCLGCALPWSIAAAMRSIAGPRCRRAQRLQAERNCRSEPGSPRHLLTGVRSSFASIPAATRLVHRTEGCLIVARILLAEDEDTLRSLIVRALTQEGHE